jgi:hypothetical protein
VIGSRRTWRYGRKGPLGVVTRIANSCHDNIARNNPERSGFGRLPMTVAL